MGNRSDLQKILEEIADNVYYQPPSGMNIRYPAIIYTRRRIDNLNASNNVYIQNLSYTITVIDRKPDSEIVEKVSRLPGCKHDTHYIYDGLNHDTFTIYY